MHVMLLHLAESQGDVRQLALGHLQLGSSLFEYSAVAAPYLTM